MRQCWDRLVGVEIESVVLWICECSCLMNNISQDVIQSFHDSAQRLLSCWFRYISQCLSPYDETMLLQTTSKYRSASVNKCAVFINPDQFTFIQVWPKSSFVSFVGSLLKSFHRNFVLFSQKWSSSVLLLGFFLIRRIPRKFYSQTGVMICNLKRANRLHKVNVR